jgi:hypothetical protein
MSVDARAALFIMLGQAAERAVATSEGVVPKEALLLSSSYDLATVVPDKVRRATDAAEGYRLLFVFETYLREFIVEVLSKDTTVPWWDKVPKDVQEYVTKLEETEEVKSWMALGSRDKSALMTLPQLIRVMEEVWKGGFDEVVRDRQLIQTLRPLGHLRNTICHMSTISAEETDRIRQAMRDWFRIVAP